MVPKVQKKLVKAGTGKITVDSGAAESVMPKAMLGNEALVAGAAKLAGVKYVAANGARMDNHGEKQVRAVSLLHRPDAGGSKPGRIMVVCD